MSKVLTIISNLFDELNLKKIRYIILRNYQNIEDINNSEDLDVSISLDDRKFVREVLKKQNWMKPRFNLNKFGHEQFYKWDGKKLYKLDIIWGCYFSNGKYCLSEMNSIYINHQLLNGLKVPCAEIGMELLLLHVVLDKKKLSINNKQQIEYYLNKTEGSFEHKIAELILDRGIDNYIINLYLKELLKRKIIIKKSVFLFNGLFFLKKVINKMFKKRIKIAFIGVDGAGKSTIVERAKEYYSHEASSEYFGFKDYRTAFSKKHIVNRKKKLPIISSFFTVLSMYFEMIYRYFSVMRKKTRLKIFDRYVWEAFDNAETIITRITFWILFKFLFPRVNGIIYLHCAPDVSLSRKNDIDNVAKFLKMKSVFDSRYLGKKGIHSINTGLTSVDDAIGEVVSYIFLVSHGEIK